MDIFPANSIMTGRKFVFINFFREHLRTPSAKKTALKSGWVVFLCWETLLGNVGGITPLTLRAQRQSAAPSGIRPSAFAS